MVLYHLANGGDYAWRVDIDYGYDDNNYKSLGYYVRAVRSGQSGSFDDLIIHGDGTVTDLNAGLTWQRAPADKKMSWSDALDYCENLNLAGHTDWRLPSREELRSIVDYSKYSPAVDGQAFPGTHSSSYWSSTTDASNADDAWRVDFHYGDDYNYDKSSSYYVRAVRSGQGWSLDDLVISAPEQGAVWGVGNTQEIVWNDEGIPGTVNIKLSRQGGTEGTYETIIATTENDGSYHWTVTGPGSENCTLKIVPSDPDALYTNNLAWITPDVFTIDSS